MNHPLVMYAVLVELGERRVEADAQRYARSHRTSRSKGLVGSLVRSARSAFRSTDARGAATAA